MHFIIASLTLSVLAFKFACGKYLPTWDSIDSRPLPTWYDESKFGIFIHWGVFAVPSFGSEWFWNFWKTGKPQYVKFMKDQYPPSFTYQDFGHDFDAYFFDPQWWAELIKNSGANYVVITSKHHEGYTLWPSNVSFSWNAKDLGPNRDLLSDFESAIRKNTNIYFGVYHSLFEWFNPLFLDDKVNNFKTNRFVTHKAFPELFELVNLYKPDIVWSDGDAGPPEYWNSTGFLAWLYNDSPVKDVVVVNDRWGTGTGCHHGGFWTCSDRYSPNKVVNHKWENCYTLDKASWGYRRDATLNDYLTDVEVIAVLAETVSYGGNLLLNIGPRKDGRIDPLMEERLRNIGQWLRVNGEAIYRTHPWIHQNETLAKVWYTSKKNNIGKVDIYAIVLSWPAEGVLHLRQVNATEGLKISMLGCPTKLKWKAAENQSGLFVYFDTIPFSRIPSTVAWALKLENLQN